MRETTTRPEEEGGRHDQQPEAPERDAGAKKKAIARRAKQRREQQKKPALPTFSLDGAGGVLDGAGAKVGIVGQAGPLVAVDEKGKVVPLEKAGCGRVIADGEHALLRVVEAQLPGEKEGEEEEDGEEQAAATKAKSGPVALELGKAPRAVLSDGSLVLSRGGEGWEPVAPTAMPKQVGKLDSRSRIRLDDGQVWAWMSFAAGQEAAAQPRWVSPERTPAEMRGRRAQIVAEAEKLPSGSQMRRAVEERIAILSLVSTIEGTFDSDADSTTDTSASLGIFQWAASRNATEDKGSSLGKFFTRLKERAEAGSAKAAGERSDEDRLAIEAWEQCKGHQLDVSGASITIGGKAVTGGRVESEMREEMGTGSLRTYQLLAARDWVEETRNTIVRPGPCVSGLGDLRYTEWGGTGGLISLTHDGCEVKLQARGAVTVGAALGSEEALATAVNLGINRPHYVEGAVWRMQSPADATDQIGAAVRALVAAARKQKPKIRLITDADVDGMVDEVKQARDRLAGLLWPAGTVRGTPADVEAQFRHAGLAFYPANQREKRARRLVTGELQR